MSLSKVIEIARGELGTTEEPVNRVKYNDAYYGKAVSGSAYPWCVVFLWWVFQEAQERMAFFGGGRTASCSMLLRWYREQGLTVPVSEVQVGDIVLLNFNGKGTPDHCGIVVDYSIRVNPKTGAPDFVVTIEGNTTPGREGSQDNGGSVALKNRDFWNIVGVCRPQYKEEEPEVVDDISNHWAKASIEWAKERGLVKGYPDGSFKPNQAVTRAEMCVMLERFFELLWEDDMR